MEKLLSHFAVSVILTVLAFIAIVVFLPLLIFTRKKGRGERAPEF